MKTTFIKTASITFGLFIVAAMNAQTSTTTNTKTVTTATAEMKTAKVNGPTAAQTAKAEKQTAKLTEILKLNAEQQVKVKAVTLDAIVKEEQQRIDAKGDAAKLAELKKNIDSNREASLKPILTAQQYTALLKAFEESKKGPATK